MFSSQPRKAVGSKQHVHSTLPLVADQYIYHRTYLSWKRLALAQAGPENEQGPGTNDGMSRE